MLHEVCIVETLRTVSEEENKFIVMHLIVLFQGLLMYMQETMMQCNNMQKKY